MPADPESVPVAQAEVEVSAKLCKGGAAKVKQKQPAGKKKAEQAKREKTAEGKAALQRKAHAMLAQPFSAFMLFGFSQRGILKKPKESIRGVVKAVGERWLLLSDTERARYEAMAEEDGRRARHLIQALL